jgi:hypothetical protein
MSKRKRKHSLELPKEGKLSTITVDMTEGSRDIGETLAQRLTDVRTSTLNQDGDMRDVMLKLRVDTAHTIAELEAWRDEIDRTLAFLKAR